MENNEESIQFNCKTKKYELDEQEISKINHSYFTSENPLGNETILKDNLSKFNSSGIFNQKEEQKKPKNVYNHKKLMENFMKSNEGLTFLANSFKLNEDRTLLEKIDDVIDFYTAWATEFPVRKNLLVDKYEFLKEVEDFCEKKGDELVNEDY
ncbi:hypothetical protein NUSPORA_00726 [Nucleospora cyclopteri]